MRLYHMTRLETAMKFIIPARRLRISQFGTLNDPFELLSSYIAGKDGRHLSAYLHSHWGRSIGIVSMVKHWKSPLMWGHYAENHTGICLGFDVIENGPVEVEYVQERREFTLDKSKPMRGITEELLRQLVSTKYSQWAYEEEWRVFHNIKQPEADGYSYWNFGPTLQLREIVLGARCKASQLELAEVVHDNEFDVKIIKTRAAFKAFEMATARHHPPLIIKGVTNLK